MAAKLYDTTRMSRYYNGPVSDHFDGARFFDPHEFHKLISELP
jgi:hypothetical protein